jgi:hypothetical protein
MVTGPLLGEAVELAVKDQLPEISVPELLLPHAARRPHSTVVPRREKADLRDKRTTSIYDKAGPQAGGYGMQRDDTIRTKQYTEKEIGTRAVANLYVSYF